MNDLAPGPHVSGRLTGESRLGPQTEDIADGTANGENATLTPCVVPLMRRMPHRQPLIAPKASGSQLRTLGVAPETGRVPQAALCIVQQQTFGGFGGKPGRRER